MSDEKINGDIVALRKCNKNAEISESNHNAVDFQHQVNSSVEMTAVSH